MSHEREVIIKLVVERDVASVTRATRGVQDSIRQVQQQVTGSARQISTAMTSITKGMDWSPIIRDANRLGLSIQQLSGYLNKADQASLKLWLQNQKLAAQAGTMAEKERALRVEREMNLRQGAAAATNAARAQQRYAYTTQTAMLSASRSMRRAVGGAMSLARSLAMLSATSEEDLAKVIAKLIKIQLVFDGLRGGWMLIEGLARAWRSYAKATTAAAAAQTTLAVAQAASGMTAAGGAGAVGLTAARGSNVATYSLLGAGAGGAGAAGAGGVVAAGTAATVGAAAAALASSLFALASVVTFAKDAWKYGFMGGGTPGGYQETVGRKIGGVSTWALRNIPGVTSLWKHAPEWTVQGAIYQQYLGEEETQRAQEWQTTRRGLEARTARREGILDIGRKEGVRRQVEGLQEQQKRLVDLARERVKPERETLDLLRQQLVVVQKQQRGAETWIGADPRQRAQLQSAKARFQAGRPTDRDLMLLGGMRGMGIEWLEKAFDPAVKQKFLGDPRAQKFFGEDYFGKVKGARPRADLTVEIKEQEVKIKLIQEDREQRLTPLIRKVAELIAAERKKDMQKFEEMMIQKLREHAEGEAVGRRAAG